MIIVLVTNFNNEEWIEKSLNSLILQRHKDWQAYVIDDVSTDASPEIIQKFASNDDRFRFIKNDSKKYQIGNYCDAISGLEDSDICVTLDGDDWLADDQVFDRVCSIYDDKTWLAWGGMTSISETRTYNPSIEDVFKSWHVPFHLRTWRAFLWKRIDDRLLRDNNGCYFKVAGDLAFMIEMANLATPLHSKTFDELNYIYNDANKMCNHLVKSDEQLANDAIIRNRRKKRIYL